MEREEAQKRKRARDDDDNTNNESKKQENNCINKPHGHGCYEFCDGINGVFDFPWLKEGLVLDDDLDEHAHTFWPCWYVDQAFPAYFDQSSSPLTLDDDAGFWSLLVNEPVDCIWNCVIDQPLDMGFTFNKAL